MDKRAITSAFPGCCEREEGGKQKKAANELAFYAAEDVLLLMGPVLGAFKERLTWCHSGAGWRATR